MALPSDRDRDREKVTVVSEGEVARLKSALREKDETLRSLKFQGLEERVADVEEQLSAHPCKHTGDWELIRDNQEELKNRLESLTKIRFWGALTGVVAIILAVLSAVYAFAVASTKWDSTTTKVERIETSVDRLATSVQDLTVSFKLMEKQQLETQEKLKEAQMTPEKIEEAVRKAVRSR